jgi:hypothetical protein
MDFLWETLMPLNRPGRGRTEDDQAAQVQHAADQPGAHALVARVGDLRTELEEERRGRAEEGGRRALRP